jgi:hypothetical protein
MRLCDGSVRSLDFFTTERTEHCLRATEYGNFLGELLAPRDALRGATSLPPVL